MPLLKPTSCLFVPQLSVGRMLADFISFHTVELCLRETILLYFFFAKSFDLFYLLFQLKLMNSVMKMLNWCGNWIFKRFGNSLNDPGPVICLRWRKFQWKRYQHEFHYGINNSWTNATVQIISILQWACNQFAVDCFNDFSISYCTVHQIVSLTGINFEQKSIIVCKIYPKITRQVDS